MSDAQQPDPRPGHYYVSVVDGSRKALLAGPWPDHAAALAMVDVVRNLACELEPRAHWYAFGTARVEPTRHYSFKCMGGVRADPPMPARLGSLNRELVRRKLAELPV